MAVLKQKRILLALDGSDHSFTTVDYVSKIIPPTIEEVVLYHAVSKIPDAIRDIEPNPMNRAALAKIDAWEAGQNNMLAEFMEKARQTLLEAGFPQQRVKVKIQEIDQGVAGDIAAESQRGYNALVVGRGGWGKLKDLLLGSTAKKILEMLSHGAVCLVDGKNNRPKTLLAFDGSKGAMRAADFYGALTQGSDQEFTLFHVVRSIDVPTNGPENSLAMKESVLGLVGDHLKSIKSKMDRAKARLLRLGFEDAQVLTKIITGADSRAGAIIEEALSGQYGSIVVGRRGISDPADHSLGRVSDKVVHLSKDMAVWVIG